MRLIDQTKLPLKSVFLELGDYREMVAAIKEMRIRGAPALGVAAAYAAVLGAQKVEAVSQEEFLAQLEPILREITSSRPTAVNISWAVNRMRRTAEGCPNVREMGEALLAEAKRIQRQDEEANRALGLLGARLIQDKASVLTHCNTGALATGGYGTALGVIRAASEGGKINRVYMTETRPFLQGSRLTAWELVEEGIPATLITDSMAGHFLKKGGIDCVIVGADRVVANGDVANKIGTYTIAVLAKENRVPFYVAAPISTVDLSISLGEQIPIEERSKTEVTHFMGVQVAPEGIEVENPAFDVTPHRYVSAIITEKGVVREPYDMGLRSLMDKSNDG